MPRLVSVALSLVVCLISVSGSFGGQLAWLGVPDDGFAAFLESPIGGRPNGAMLVATTNLGPGDVAVIGVNTEDTGNPQRDFISFLLLRPIGSTTQIFFTDRSWNGTAFSATGGADAGDGTFTYTAATDLAAGTVLTINQAQLTAAGMALDQDGDTIYVYQGTNANAPTAFLHAVELADGNNTFGGNLVNTGLVAGTSAVAVADDNIEFGGRTHNISPTVLFGRVNDFHRWVHNDNSPQDGTNGLNAVTGAGTSDPAFTAPDAQILVGASGGGEAIVTINLDATYASGTLGYQIVQAFQNDLNLFHPSDITLDTVHGKFFFADSDAATHNRIVEGSISQLLNNPGDAATFNILYSNSGSSAFGIISSLSVDTASGIIYFDVGTGTPGPNTGSTFNKISYSLSGASTLNQVPTVMATLGNGHYVTQISIDYAHGTVLLATSRIIAVFGTDVVEQNYVYRATGLTAGSASLTFSELPFNPDDNDAGAPNNANIPGLPGEAWPVERGTVRGIDIDEVNQVAYIVTGSVSLDVSVAQDGSQLQTFFGGVYRYNLLSNANGDVTLLYQQNGASGPLGLLYYIEVDPATGRYYVVDENGVGGTNDGIWTGSLTVAGTPTLVSYVDNINGLGPRGLEIQHAPTLASTFATTPTYTETPGADSPNGTPIVLSTSHNSTDADSGAATVDQLAGAQVRISANFQNAVERVDVLTINGLTSGVIELGAQDIGFSYDQATGVMTLTGRQTLDNYEAALALVRFRADGDNPTNYGTVGTRTISYSMFDGLLYSDETNVTVTVVGINDAPVNGVPAAQAVNEDTNLSITGLSTSDLDANPASQPMTTTLSVTNGTLTVLPAGGAAVSGSGTATVTLTGTTSQINTTLAAASNIVYRGVLNYFGPDTLVFKTNDQGNTGNDPGITGTGTSEEDTDNIGITVNPVNDIPSFTKGADQTVLEDAGALTVGGWATAISAGPANESTQVVDFIVTNTNNGLFSAQPAVAANGTLTYTPAANANGTASVSVRIHDDGTTANGGVDTSAIQTFNISVTAVNDAPTLNAIADPTAILEDAVLQTVNLAGITSGPANESTQTITVTAVSNNTALIPNPTVSYTSPNTTGSLSYTPVANANGSAVITVTVMDNGLTANSGVDTTTRQFTVNVTAVNDVPSFTKGPDQTVLEDAAAQTVSGWATAISAGPPNESGQVVDFIVTNNNNPLFSVQPAVSATGDLTYTLAANANGTASVSVRIHDNGGTTPGVDTSAIQTFNINVTAVNDVPSFIKGANQSVPKDSPAQTVPGWATSISAGAPDESGQALNFIVTNNNNPLFTVQPAVAANGTLTYTPAPGQTGTATVSVSLHDNGGGADTSAVQTFTITLFVPCTPANVVTTLADSGPGSLRDALATTCAGGAITFNIAGGGNQVLQLLNPLPPIDRDMTIAGPTTGSLTIKGQFVAGPLADGVNPTPFPVFTFRGTTGPPPVSEAVPTAANVSLSNINITGGSSLPGVCGGGILNDHATLTLTNVTVYGNTAGQGAGVCNYGSGPGPAAILNLVNSTISGNTATAEGGGISNQGQNSGNAVLNITNSTIAGNSATGGAGIANYGFSTGSGVTNLRNTILSNVGSNLVSDTSSGGTGTIASQGYNLSSDAAGGDATTGPGGFLNAPGDIRNSNAALGPLAFNGGSTETHTLLNGSRAIDQGSAVAGLSTDQRGSTRPVDFLGINNASGGDGSDIGAVEMQISTAGEVSLSGRVLSSTGRGVTNAKITVSGGSLPAPVTVTTGRLGGYVINGLTAGETYIVTAAARRFTFDQPTRVITLNDNATGVDFIARPPVFDQR